MIAMAPFSTPSLFMLVLLCTAVFVVLFVAGWQLAKAGAQMARRLPDFGRWVFFTLALLVSIALAGIGIWWIVTTG